MVQNGQVVLKKGYGFAEPAPGPPVDPDRTLFRIGSISKTFTWIALMKEVEAGRIRLDQPINLYLPEKLQVQDQGFDRPIRVIDLMDHSAGVRGPRAGPAVRGQLRPGPATGRLPAPGAAEPGARAGRGLQLFQLRRRAGRRGRRLDVTGKPFERLIEEEIIAPLGLAHTTFREPHPAKAGPARADAGGARRRRPSPVPLDRRRASARSLTNNRPDRPGRRRLLHGRRHGPLHDRCSSAAGSLDGVTHLSARDSPGFPHADPRRRPA